MKLLLPPLLFTALFVFSCNDGNRLKNQGNAETAIANDTDLLAPMPKDVIYTSQSLINGNLYARPSFDGTIIAHFDTSQQLYITDTSHQVFVKARLQHDTTLVSGYVSKAILPQRP